MEKIHLSVVIPAYNEEKRISATLLDIDKYLSKQNYSYEIVVVNDGSKDNTAGVVKKIQELVKNLRLINNQENHGKGWVTKQGMLEAKGEYRIYVDADNAISLDQVENFWPELKHYDVVIGSIELKGSKIEEHAGWHRRFLGKFSKYIIRIVAGLWEIHDTQRAFKIFPAKVAYDVFSRQTIYRWGFDIEILVLTKRLGYKIKELPVTWINPGESKVTLKSYIRTFMELLKIKWNLITDKYKLSSP
jgi:glycosyltransferase involved in cell wall biosynthesis